MNFKDSLLNCFYKPQIVPELLSYAHNQISKLNSDIDFYSSLDHFYEEYLIPSIDTSEYSDATSQFNSNSSSCNVSSLVDYSYYISRSLHYLSETRNSVPYWKGTSLDIFFHPLLVGFSTHGYALTKLGWGSSRYAAHLSHFAKQITTKSIFTTGRTVIVLTRHRSKYAHFVRDRFSKFIWANHIFSLSTIETLVFDYPLTQSEIDCLRYAGYNGSFIYMSEHLYLSLQGEILVFEVCTGIPLLPALRDWILEQYIPTLTSYPYTAQKVYLTRGSSARRNVSLDPKFDAFLTSKGYITYELSKLPILDQLSCCVSSNIVIGIHGAQLINSLLVDSTLVEILPYPYCLSPWSHTMMKMSDILSINYIPYLASQLAESDDLMSDVQFCNFPSFPGQAEDFQSSQVNIHLDTFSNFLNLVDP